MTEILFSDLYKTMRAEAEKVIVGLEEPFEQLVMALFSGGHVLLEGVPGTAKTLMAKTLAHLVEAQFTRVQFTPDLMPSDILGTNVFNLTTNAFFLRKGPIFTQVMLADEINRAPAKTQSALLEAMEERQVNLDGVRHPLGNPFMVIATQNPIEYEGTYPLPEAQLDRFMFKIRVPVSPSSVELEVLRRYHAGFDARNLEAAGLRPVVALEMFKPIQDNIQAVLVEEGVLDYITRICAATRRSPDIILGASTRSAIHILLTAKACAGLRGRTYVIPDDIKYVVPPVMRHRLILKPETEIEGLDTDAVIQRILAQVDVPR